MAAGRWAICWTLRRGDAGPYCAMELEMQPLRSVSPHIRVSMQGHQTNVEGLSSKPVFVDGQPSVLAERW